MFIPYSYGGETLTPTSIFLQTTAPTPWEMRWF